VRSYGFLPAAEARLHRRRTRKTIDASGGPKKGHALLVRSELGHIDAAGASKRTRARASFDNWPFCQDCRTVSANHPAGHARVTDLSASSRALFVGRLVGQRVCDTRDRFGLAPGSGKHSKLTFECAALRLLVQRHLECECVRARQARTVVIHE
jgi:hypothetical protein